MGCRGLQNSAETDFIYIEAVRSCHYHAPPPVPPGTKSSGSRGEGEDLCTSANLLHIFCDVFPLENWKFIFPSCDLIYPLAIVPASHIFLNNQVFYNPLIICLSPLLLPLLSCGPQTWMEEKSWTLPSLLSSYVWQLMQDLGGNMCQPPLSKLFNNTFSLSFQSPEDLFKTWPSLWNSWNEGSTEFQCRSQIKLPFEKNEHT